MSCNIVLMYLMPIFTGYKILKIAKVSSDVRYFVSKRLIYFYKVWGSVK